jgi:dipeptidyl aminopeptidase/acylaminoacyl peptidase
VLRVNFRGSGNYGREHIRAGYQQWGLRMQDDLADATRWAIAQGFADKDRVCIYGASYGGYAALMGAAKDPDLYRCVIGYIGVYDLPLMYQKGDIRDSDTGKNYLQLVLGGNRQAHAAASPNRLAAKIKAPVFLAAGGSDERAPLQHSEMMRDALIAAGNKPEWLMYPDEGHGFYQDAHNVEFYTRLLGFLDRHIGPGAKQ